MNFRHQTFQGEESIWIDVRIATAADVIILYRDNVLPRQASDGQKLAHEVLHSLLDEVHYYRIRRCFAQTEAEIGRLHGQSLSEFGTVLVARHGKKLVAAAFIHVTWKCNVFLDWMAVMPDYMAPERKIHHLGEIMFKTLLYFSRQRMGARLFFVESKIGLAAKSYKKWLNLSEECAFILLRWSDRQGVAGWEFCGPNSPLDQAEKLNKLLT